MSDIGIYLTLGELVARHDEADLLALCGTGGWNGNAGRTIDQVRLQAHLDRAQSFISGYVKSRYPNLTELPSTEMPDALKGAASDLVLYWLRDRVSDKSGVTDEWRSRYRDALAWLRDLQAGKADLGLVTDASNSAEDSSGIRASFGTSRSDDILEGYL